VFFFQEKFYSTGRIPGGFLKEKLDPLKEKRYFKVN
jgi:Polyribonucleotide nucleotidyltransferase (polynucleotide phosphorylase)